MAQEEVTRQAPRYEDVLGSPETQALTNTSSNVLPGRSAEDVAKELGISIGASRANYKTVASQEDPFAATGLEDTYQFEDKVFEQSALADFGAGLFNGLVIDTGEGLANLIPTVAQALGSEAEFLDAWSTNVSGFFENQRAVYSDEAYNTIDEFGDINASNVATALGQGVGFLTAIIAGGGIAGGLSRGAKVLSRAGKTAKGLAAAAETAKASGDVGRTIKAIETANSFAGKTKNIIAAAQKGQQQASRVGTFLAGTTLMYPSIHKEAIEAGLDKGAAARFALGVSGLVSMTEGAALEWIGKIATKPLTNVIASQASKKVLKNAANGDPIALMKMFVPEYTSALKGKMGVIMEGAAVEFGQEAGQTYIEEGAKQLYDTVYKGQDKGYFGSDVTTKKTFVEAIYGGAIGAVLGGVMAGGQRPDSLGNELSQEGMFGYINNAVSQNKKGNIDKVKQAITDLVVNGKMTKTEGERATKVVDDLTAFATKVRPTKIKDNVAKYQLYQLDALGNSTTAIQESFEEKANDKNPKIAAEYKKKQGMISSVQQALQAEFDSIYDTGQKQTGNKVAFDTKLEMYKSLMNDVAKSGVTEDEFKIRMEAITSLNDSVHAAKGSKENTVSVDGVDFSIDVVDTNMDKLLDLSEQLERKKITTEQFEKELKDKFGLSPEQAKVVAQFEFKQKYDLLKAQAIKTQAAQTQQATQTGNKTSTTTSIQKKINDTISKIFGSEALFDFNENQPGKVVRGQFIPDNIGDQMFEAMNKTLKGEVVPTDEKEAARLFKEYAKVVHPDKNTQSDEHQVIAEAFFKAMQTAKDKGRVDILNELKNKFDTELAALEATQSGNKTKTSEKKQGKVKMKAYRTEGTGMGKLSQAHRGSGKYYGLDKFFSTGKKGETFSEVELEIDEDTTLDLTESQKTGKETKASVKYKEITDEARKRLEALPKNEVTTDTYNDLVRDVALEKGVTGVISYIEPGAPDIATMMNIGREYVDYSKPAESKEATGAKSDIDLISTPVSKIVEELSKLKTLNEKLDWLKNNNLLSPININGKEYNTIDYLDRVMVLMKIGKYNIPFYISTGQAGKKNVKAGNWYAVFGIGVEKGWINKGSEEQINNNYGFQVFEKLSKILNEGIGVIESREDNGNGKLKEGIGFLSDSKQDLEAFNDNMNLPTKPAGKNTDIKDFYDHVNSTLSLLNNELKELAALQSLKETSQAGTTEQSLENLTTDELKAKSQEIKDKLKKLGDTANINDVSRMIDQYKVIDDVLAKRDSKLDEMISAVQEEKTKQGLSVDMAEDVFSDMTDSQVETMEAFVEGKKIDPLKAQYLSDYLYSKYKELIALRNNPKRQYTVEQINAFREQLEIDLHDLAVITEGESSFLQSTRVKPAEYGKAKKKTNAQKKGEQREETRLRKRLKRQEAARLKKENEVSSSEEIKESEQEIEPTALETTIETTQEVATPAIEQVEKKKKTQVEKKRVKPDPNKSYGIEWSVGRSFAKWDKESKSYTFFDSEGYLVQSIGAIKKLAKKLSQKPGMINSWFNDFLDDNEKQFVKDFLNEFYQTILAVEDNVLQPREAVLLRALQGTKFKDKNGALAKDLTDVNKKKWMSKADESGFDIDTFATEILLPLLLQEGYGQSEEDVLIEEIKDVISRYPKGITNADIKEAARNIDAERLYQMEQEFTEMYGLDLSIVTETLNTITNEKDSSIFEESEISEDESGTEEYSEEEVESSSLDEVSKELDGYEDDGGIGLPSDEKKDDGPVFQARSLAEGGTEIKPGVSELFESNPELAKLGTKEQYSQYLDSIFPDSKVKDIVYHGSPNTEIKSFLSPEKEGYKKQETTTIGVAGIYFSDKKEVANLYQDFKKEGIKGRTYPAVINTKRPLVVGDKATDGFTEGTFGASALWNIQKGVLQGLRKAGIDAIKTGEYASKTSVVGENVEIAVFEPEQIHILGGKQDIEGFKEFVNNPVLQKKRFAEVSAANETIKNNPTLFNNIRNFFKAAFPNVSVEIVDSMMEKYGFDALASAYNNMINIQKDTALQSSIIHEYAEIYVASLGLDHPLVKMGMELVKGTEMHKRAIEAYPELSAEGQLKEALMETIALKGLAQLKTKFEGTTTEKIMAWLKRFWNRIAGMFNSKKYNELDKLTKGLLNNRTTYKTGSLSGVRFQKNYSSTKAAAGMYIQNTISKIRLAAIKNPDIDVNNPVLLRREIYEVLLQRYYTEKDPEKTTSDKIFENINLKEDANITDFFNAIQEKNEWLKNFINESIKSVTRVSKVTDRDLAENEGIIKADSSNAIKANKGFSPSVRSVISSIVDNEGKAMPINEVYRYVASVATSSLNAEDFFRRIKQKTIDHPKNLIYDRVYNLLKHVGKEDRQMLLYEMSNVRQNVSKKFGLSKEIDRITGIIKNKSYVKQLNKDYETSTTVGNYLNNIKNFNDIEALENIFEDEMGWYQNFSLQAVTQSNSEFAKRLSAVKITERTRTQYNQLLSLLIGNEVPIEYTNSLIDSGIDNAQKVLYRVATNTPNYKFGKGALQEPLDINSTLSKIAQAVEGTEGLLNSYVNSNGENVTSTSVTHWMDDLARMYQAADPKRLEEAQMELFALEKSGIVAKEDIADLKKLIKQLRKAIKYKDNYKKSELYKNNTILNLADRNQGKINYFNADAIDNDGKVRELSEQSKNDIVITQLIAFANDPSKSTYSQQYGIQGDRPRSMFFEAPRLRGVALEQAYNDIINADQFLYKQYKKEVEKKFKDKESIDKALERYRNTYNKSGLTKMDAEGNVRPPSQEDINKRVKAIKRIVEASGLGEVAVRDEEGELTGEVIPSVLAADHVKGENALYKTEDEMYENFVRNESINRTHLNNLFQGPAVQRKSIEDHIKRALGTNSTAMLTNIDKPVVTVVIKAKSKVVFDKKGNPINTSDSMSINGSRLHTHLAKEVGGFERLGSNIKDLLFQINPLTGKMAFLKMSTIGIVGKPGDNNLTRMTNAENTTGRTGYAEIAEVAFQLEELIGDKKYLKIVDEKAIKGNEGADVVALDIDELMAIQKEEDPAKKAALLQSIIDNNSFELEYDGYRIPFKMHKDLSKVALKDQKAVVSTQATKIALNTGHASDVIKLEKAIVKLLKKNLGLKKGDGYKTSSIYKKFKQTANIINGVLAGSEDSGKESVVHLLDGIKQYNDSLDAETKDMKVSLTALRENNKDVTKRSDEVVKEITSLESKINAIESKKITALDHPNLKGMVEQYIGSAMTTTAARAEMAGNYLHMVPNYSNDLKAPTKISVKMSENQLTRFKSKIKKNEEKLERLKSNPNSLEENIKKQENYLSKLKAEYASGVKETLTDFEVAVPWSMFGSSLEEAQAFLNKRKAEGKPVKVVVVRVPASDAVSTFAADVAYFIDGESNMAIVPDQFVKMSDADHDGDKVFVYREELTSDEEGKTVEVESAASELFWNMYNQISSDEIRERQDNDLSTTEIEEILDKHGLRNAEGYSLEGHDDVAEVLSKYSFGAKAIGIEAVAGKLLSMFTQSNVSLKNSITYKGVQYKAFVPDNQIAVAKILQAALDMGNDPILLETGINKYTIGAANAMLYLGVSLEDTILMMRNPAIQDFINEVDADKSVFSKYSGKFEDTLSREADKLAGITRTELTMSAARAWSKGAGLQKKGQDFFKVGQIYATKDKEVAYFRVGKDAETGKLIIVDENVGPNNSPAVDLIKSFLEFHEVAEEIKGIIPVVQMDNSMPKNSEELRKSLESFEKLRSGRTIDFTPLLDRPLLQHYESVLDLMVDLEQTHFATEKGSYGAEGKNNMINEIERAFKKDYSNRNKIVDTFTRMVAQGESPVSQPAKFEKTFVSRLTNILEYIKEGALVHANKDYNDLLSYHNSGNIEEYNNLIQWMENGLSEVDKNKLRNDVKEWISFNDGILNSIKDPNNMFINAITIQTNKQGVSSIVPKKGYRLQGEHIKEQIRQDFLKIMDTPLGQDFISYQMLKNGVSDKIGSLIDMMPREISVNYLRKMSKIKDSGKTQPNFKQAHKLNALMYNKSDLPKAMISNYGTWLNQGWSRDKNDNVIYAYKGASSTLGVEHIRALGYYNENKITKFDPNATLTKESYEKLKNQCK